MTTPTPDKLEISEAAVAQAAAEIADAVMGNDHLMHILDEQQRQEVNADIRIEARRVISPLPHMPDRGYAEVGVRSLEWCQDGSGHWKAGASSIGTYHIVLDEAGSFTLRLSWSFMRSDGDFTSFDEAKAAAQADFDARVRSALIAPPAAVSRGYAEGIEAAAELVAGYTTATNSKHFRRFQNKVAIMAGNRDLEMADAILALAPPAPADNGGVIPMKPVSPIVGAFTDVLGSLVAAVSLLERGGKQAAPSNKMFVQMLADYKASVLRGRDAYQAYKSATPSPIEDVAGPGETDSRAFMQGGILFRLEEALRSPNRSFGLTLVTLAPEFAHDAADALAALAARRVRPSPVDEDSALFAHAWDVPDQMVFDALHASVPGGAEVWHWLPQEADEPNNPNTARPHPTAYEVIRSAIFGALQSQRKG